MIGGMDAAGLGGRFNEQGPEGLVNKPLQWRAASSRTRRFWPHCVRGPDPGDPRRGALADLRSDHAIARGVWHLGLGRHGLPRLEGIRPPLTPITASPRRCEAMKRDSRGSGVRHR
jgi:hypothetical protein